MPKRWQPWEHGRYRCHSLEILSFYLTLMRNLGQQWELGTTSCAAPPSLPWSHWGIGQLILIPLLICKVLWLMSDRGWKSLSWRAGLSLHLVPLTWMPSRWAWVNQCLLSRGPQVLSLLVLLSPERWVSFLTAISWWVSYFFLTWSEIWWFLKDLPWCMSIFSCHLFCASKASSLSCSYLYFEGGG